MSALNLFHVNGVSIVHGPPPVEKELMVKEISEFPAASQETNSGRPEHLEDGMHERTCLEPIRAKSAEGSIFTVDSFKTLQKIMDVHPHLDSKSKAEVRQALKVIRSQLFDQVDENKNRLLGGSIAIINFKALEHLLSKTDAKARNEGLTKTERYLVENSLKIFYDLRSFSKLPAERIWFNHQIKEFLSTSDSIFLMDEYSKAVRQAQVDQFLLDITQNNRGRNHSLLRFLNAPTRIEGNQVPNGDTPQDITDFVTLFNAGATETNVSDFKPIVERLYQALESPSAVNQDPQANSFRVELIALAARSFATKSKPNLHEDWDFPFFTHLMRLTKLASEPEERLQAEGLVQFSQLVNPPLNTQFIQQYPVILKDIIIQDFKHSGVKRVFDRIISNGPEDELRNIALGFKSSLERIQMVHYQGRLPSPQVEKSRLGNIAPHPLEFLRNAHGSRKMREKSFPNHPEPYLGLNFLKNALATKSSRLMAGEVIFASGLLAKMRLSKSLREFETLYKTSQTILKKFSHDSISSLPPSKKNNFFGSLADQLEI
ncbi:hypothetical protein PCANC_14768 [Puccinia coronata f. sp. avenae]|uniref:Uncharacterized protein n=1 Tax=Puccinia coronata f. sp. avenae TaxID=200324 RepID=A0A2N5UZA7_9BASI|nr:hypothetical protein PCANC_14768 [Puccinia coronata f. sp. avenae]PLW43081.1 hypothetical protein PCASD_06076 [Puccinia coronata f. sp. avenae]